MDNQDPDATVTTLGQDIQACDSATQISLAPSRVSRSNDTVVEVKVSKAGLLARAALLKEKQNLEQEEMILKQKRELLALRTELAEFEAKEQVFEMEDNYVDCEENPKFFSPLQSEDDLMMSDRHGKVHTSPVRHKTKYCPSVEAELLSDIDRQSNPTHSNLIQQGVDNKLHENLIHDIVMRSQLPKSHIAVFNGNVTEYAPFTRAFDAKIGSRLNDNEEKLYYLEQYTSGKPREIIRGCLHMPPETGYQEARRLLDRRYGAGQKRAAEYVERIEKWKTIRPDEAEELDNFAIFLRNCECATKGTMYGRRTLEHPRTLVSIVDKLPYTLQDKWRYLVDNIEETQGRLVQFEDLVDFIEKQARVALNPTFGRRVFAGGRKQSGALDRHDGRKFNLATIMNEPGDSTRCDFCDKQHVTTDCEALLNSDDKTKNEFVQERGLCYGCLRRGHRSKNCVSRSTCKICKRRHPTCLHKEEWRRSPREQNVRVSRDEESVASYQISAKADGEYRPLLPVVPVIVELEGIVTKTYAFLDSGSTHSFCSTDLLKKLEASPRTKGSLTLTTVTSERNIASRIVNGMEIRDINDNNNAKLPALFTLDKIPVTRENIPVNQDIETRTYWKDRGVTFPQLNCDVGLLLGGNAGFAMEPLEVVASENRGPYAVRTIYGWIIGGSSLGSRYNHGIASVNNIRVSDGTCCELFTGLSDTRRGLSVEDRLWKSRVDASCTRKDQGYQIGLPFRDSELMLPFNFQVAMKRLTHLGARLKKDKVMNDHYVKQMGEMIEKGYAEPVPRTQLDRRDGRVWFLPHHGVYHRYKPDKVRVVFDCACKYRDISLNDSLLQGPDLNTPLLDVLMRFRQDRIALMADIESMFMRVQVPKSDRDCLRFLWWKDGDFDTRPREYRMTVHLFGATSSPSCVTYALRKTADEYGDEYPANTSETVYNNMYVDDMLKSVGSEERAVRLAHDLRELCAKGGFNLTQFVSNSKTVLASIPKEHRDKDVRNLNLELDKLPMERALGVWWDVESDTFGFHVDINACRNKALTRRGILSTVSSIFDPLGLIAPFVIQARIQLQELNRLRLSWDEEIPHRMQKSWRRWLHNLSSLSKFNVPRCYQSNKDFGCTSTIELHHFADASEKAYGTVAYLRLSNGNGKFSCALLGAKGHVAPVKSISIPRLELAAATLAVKTNFLIRRALEINIDKVYYWTDSTTVLKYIKNSTTRFQVFVANRLGVIHDGSKVDEWRYIPTQKNPADFISRGQDGEKLIRNQLWKKGPSFLWEEEDQWPKPPLEQSLATDEYDPEIKKIAAAVSISQQTPVLSAEHIHPLQKLLEHYSEWRRLVRAVALIRRLLDILRERHIQQAHCYQGLEVSDLVQAESSILRYAQAVSFHQELVDIKADREVRIGSKLSSLSPVLRDGLIVVGGRLTNSDLSDLSKHPVIMEGRGKIAEMLIKFVHETVGHEGRQQVMTELRKRYWVLKANSAVRRVIHGCYSCRRRRGKPQNQKLADLPGDRVLAVDTPFTNTGVDYFGPFQVKQGRARVKRYGVIFTCLSSRAIHLEAADSLTTDSFICALRRFVARRGEVRRMRSDRGTNFVGADRELKKEVQKLIDSGVIIKEEMLKRNVDWVFNPPGASHFGGAWERMIRSVRKILQALLHGQPLTNEALNTFMCEVESIVNNRPLTPVSSDPCDQVPLSPNHILLLKSNNTLPVGTFTEDDMYGHKAWRQAQYLADQFWCRWRKEYLPLLQQRDKSTRRPSENLSVGDIVLLVDENVPRGRWPLGRVELVKLSNDGLVRSVDVRTRGGAMLKRPVKKLVKIAD